MDITCIYKYGKAEFQLLMMSALKCTALPCPFIWEAGEKQFPLDIGPRVQEGCVYSGICAIYVPNPVCVLSIGPANSY